MSDQSESPRRRRPSQPAPPPQGSVGRGAILVVIAVVIGIFLLRDGSDSVVAGLPVGSDGSSDTTEPEDGSSTTSSSSVPVRAPGEVKVLVANGTEVNGAAGTMSEALEALGYVTAPPATVDRVAATIVYYQASYEAEAAALAQAIGAPPTSVALLPAVAPVEDMQLANLLVVLGPDLAAPA